MDLLSRRLDLGRDLNSRSVFLFGPRQTGKTTWLHQRFPDSPLFDLLHGEAFLGLSRVPGAAETTLKRQFLVCRESVPRLIGAIQILPIEDFLKRLWDGELFA